MGKLSQLDSNRQIIERLRDVVPPPTFAQTARAPRIVPQPPKPTTIDKAGFPRSITLAVIGGAGWVTFVIAITAAFFGAPHR